MKTRAISGHDLAYRQETVILASPLAWERTLAGGVAEADTAKIKICVAIAWYWSSTAYTGVVTTLKAGNARAAGGTLI